jgi:prepilin-type N-terminal cleavage/methylation domain-containing protein
MRAARPDLACDRQGRGFTLIEILVVLGILSIILGIGLPAVFSTIRKGPMRQAVSDLQEGFLKARMLAILTGKPAELAINASDGSMQVREVSETKGEGSAMSDAGGAAEKPAEPSAAEDGEEGEGGAPRPIAGGLPSFSAKLDSSVSFKQLVINLRDVGDEPDAAIRFYPNGTSDALMATLFSESGEERSVTLEIMTGRPNFTTIR